MQTTKGRASPKESPQKVSLRPARELKIDPIGRRSSSPSSNVTTRTPKDRSPIVTDRRSPRSPICEKRRPSKLSELESQISKLQTDLRTVKDQLIASESLKNEAQADAEDLKKQLADVSLKLEESQKQFSELDASKNAGSVDQQDIYSQAEQEWRSKIEVVRQEQLDESATLKSGLDEIQRLKEQLQKVSEIKDAKEKESHTTNAELESLKNNLAETLLLVESMKYELDQTKESEAQAQNLVKQTLLQLEAAKDTINVLRLDFVNSKEANDSVAHELQQSRAHVSFLESFVDNLKKINVRSDDCRDESRNQGTDVNEIQMELEATKSELKKLRSALDASETRFNEERSLSRKQIENAAELLDQMRAQSSVKEAELEEDLKKACENIDELKASLMDKETELQGIFEENECLNTKLLKSELCHVDQKMEAEFSKLREHVAEMKASLMDKETELQNVFSENETLKLEISKKETDKATRAADMEAAQAAEVEAMTKLGYLMEEVDKSNKKVGRVTEQLEAAQAASAEMEAELRKLKVQSDQWRKAAEAAASMLSPGSNGKYVERSGSMPLGGKYSPSPYLDDYDDSFKKKNGNVLKKIGVLWKKPQK